MDQVAEFRRDDDLVLPAHVRRASRHRWRLWLAVAAAVVVASVAIVLLRGREQAPSFRTVSLELRTIVRVVEATGQLDAVSRTEVPAPAPGALVESLVQSGAAVERGQPLARLDARAATIALRSARATVRSAESREAQAGAAHIAAGDARGLAERLDARGLASESDMTQAQANDASTRAALSAARAEREVAMANLATAELGETLRTIEAPSAGVVLDAPDVIGMIAAPERGPLFVIGSALETLRVDALVSESDIGDVAVGQAATFSVPAYPERTFSARVESLSVDATHNGTRVRYLVRLSAPNPERKLLPGMTATLRIEVARAENVLSVREAALRFVPPGADTAASRSRLFRASDHDRLESIPVRAGLSDGMETEVRPETPGALKAGDAVVIGRLKPAAVGDEMHGPGISLRRR